MTFNEEFMKRALKRVNELKKETKEKIFLSNCDSIKKSSSDEVRKRILIGIVFGNGIILSPNILLENNGLLYFLMKKDLDNL